MSTRMKIRLGFIALIAAYAYFGRGGAHTAAIVTAMRILFYLALLGYAVFTYIAKRKKSDKQENLDVAPLSAAPLQNGEAGQTTRNV